ncbi:MAG: Hsp20/alpha crystallin family protein [Chloroflexi bacterium]|nr:Hsp20/alpha crystallin family protein [Chloroflexota bacterium]
MPDEKAKKKKGPVSGDILGGSLDILGLKIDLGDLLSAPEQLAGRLEELREKLKAAGGKESLSDEEWRSGAVSGHIRVRDLSGEREFHVGTTGRHRARPAAERPGPPEVDQPPLDIFDEAGQVTVVADVPGVNLQDLDLDLQGNALTISTKPRSRRQYRKSVQLDADVDPDSMSATCRNGVLEVSLQKRSATSP